MATLNVQFHATVDELVEFTGVVLVDPSVEALAVRYNPFEATRMSCDDASVTLLDPRVRRIVFTRGRSNAIGTGNLELLDANPGALVLDVGREGPTGVSESRLSASVGRAAWKRELEELNRRTVAGAIGVHEKTGATAEYRTHRLSPGAVALSTSGVALRPFSSSPVVYRPLGG